MESGANKGSPTDHNGGKVDGCQSFIDKPCILVVNLRSEDGDVPALCGGNLVKKGIRGRYL